MNIPINVNPKAIAHIRSRLEQIRGCVSVETPYYSPQDALEFVLENPPKTLCLRDITAHYLSDYERTMALLTLARMAPKDTLRELEMDEVLYAVDFLWGPASVSQNRPYLDDDRTGRDIDALRKGFSISFQHSDEEVRGDVDNCIQNGLFYRAHGARKVQAVHEFHFAGSLKPEVSWGNFNPSGYDIEPIQALVGENMLLTPKHIYGQKDFPSAPARDGVDRIIDGKLYRLNNLDAPSGFLFRHDGRPICLATFFVSTPNTLRISQLQLVRPHILDESDQKAHLRALLPDGRRGGVRALSKVNPSLLMLSVVEQDARERGFRHIEVLGAERLHWCNDEEHTEADKERALIIYDQAADDRGYRKINGVWRKDLN